MTDTARLVVEVAGNVAGVVSRQSDGALSFRYDDGYGATPLSLSMPVSNRVFADKVVRPYLLGLLPDDAVVRAGIARQFDTKASDPVALLSYIGLDCPGAVQLYPEGTDRPAARRSARYVPIDDDGIARRLRGLRGAPEDSWLGRAERWSLGGNQGKFALGLYGGRWCECHGSAATTHIFKNGMAGYRLQALNEYACMKLARACGLPVADVDYRLFDGEPAIIVTRYDRVVGGDGTVYRLHQEDLCQALSVTPDKKYTSDGGPRASDVLRLLASTAHARQNIALFTQMLFFNCLVGAPDAHAKNYSLLLAPGPDALLAPLYDVASGLAYETLRRKGRLAMSIGGENRFGRMGVKAMERYAHNGGIDELGFDCAWCMDAMTSMAGKLADALATVFDGVAEIPGGEELRSQLEGPIADNCRTIVAQLRGLA